jgi:hypothetical protein
MCGESWRPGCEQWPHKDFHGACGIIPAVAGSGQLTGLSPLTPLLARRSPHQPGQLLQVTPSALSALT